MDYLVNIIKAVRSLCASVTLNPKIKPAVFLKIDAWSPIQLRIMKENLDFLTHMAKC